MRLAFHVSFGRECRASLSKNKHVLDREITFILVAVVNMANVYALVPRHMTVLIRVRHECKRHLLALAINTGDGEVVIGYFHAQVGAVVKLSEASGFDLICLKDKGLFPAHL